MYVDGSFQYRLARTIRATEADPFRKCLTFGNLKYEKMNQLKRKRRAYDRPDQQEDVDNREPRSIRARFPVPPNPQGEPSQQQTRAELLVNFGSDGAPAAAPRAAPPQSGISWVLIPGPTSITLPASCRPSKAEGSVQLEITRFHSVIAATPATEGPEEGTIGNSDRQGTRNFSRKAQ